MGDVADRAIRGAMGKIGGALKKVGRGAKKVHQALNDDDGYFRRAEGGGVEVGGKNRPDRSAAVVGRGMPTGKRKSYVAPETEGRPAAMEARGKDPEGAMRGMMGGRSGSRSGSSRPSGPVMHESPPKAMAPKRPPRDEAQEMMDKESHKKAFRGRHEKRMAEMQGLSLSSPRTQGTVKPQTMMMGSDARQQAANQGAFRPEEKTVILPPKKRKGLTAVKERSGGKYWSYGD